MKQSGWRYLWTARDIRRKLLVTIGLMVIYRLVAHVPVPGVNRAAIKLLMEGSGAASTLVGIMDLLSGGTVANFSVLAMGVYPYITAQIILQLLVPVIPPLQRRMEKDPRESQKFMEKWTYYLAVPMAALQAVSQIRIFGSIAGMPIIDNFGFTAESWLPSLAIIFSMTAGTMFAIWLGEMISEKGIQGQGLSLLIFAGIVTRIPQNFGRLLNPAAYAEPATRWYVFGAILLITILIIAVIVYVQQGQRNVPVMYPGRRVGRGQAMPVKNYLPLRVNMAGMIPIIFAQSLLTLPAIIASFFLDTETDWVARLAVSIQTTFSGNNGWYWLFYFLGVVGFTFFYTDVIFSQQNYGESLRKSGAKVGTVRPGKPTQEYLTRVLRRITFPGALFLGVVAIMPYLVGLVLPLGQNTGTLLVSSSGLLIVVGVVRDTFSIIKADLGQRGYEDLKLF